MRLQKVLEDANIKVGSVLSDILGQSGRAMLAALMAGEEDPERLADRARGTARRKHGARVEARCGHVTPPHRHRLQRHLDLVAALETALEQIDADLGKALAPISAAADLLQMIPGVSKVVAHVIVAKIGADMSCFPASAHLISWAGLCPRSDESAGKQRSTRVRKSGPWLKTTLVTAAWAAVRTQKGYLHAQFLRIKSRRGAKKAILAVAATMLTAAYHMLRDGVEYRDLGDDYFNQRDRSRAITRLVRRLNELGCEVELKQVA